VSRQARPSQQGPGEWFAVGPARFELGEGGRWDGSAFWQVDLLAGTLWRAHPGMRDLQVIAQADRPVGCLVPTTTGFLILAGRGVAVLRPSASPHTDLRMLCEPAPRGHRINDGAVANGRLYFGSMDEAGTMGQGALWRMDPDGSVTRLLDGLGCPNGPAFTPDGTTMYLADSTSAEICRYPVLPDGTLGKAELFTKFRPEGGIPDGMVVDHDCRLWVAVWDGGAIRRYHADGTLDVELAVPARRPTSVTAVPGALVVTTARIGLADPGDMDGATLKIERAGRPTAVHRLPIDPLS
jgi:sugar lactone lactonase YvrE